MRESSVRISYFQKRNSTFTSLSYPGQEIGENLISNVTLASSLTVPVFEVIFRPKYLKDMSCKIDSKEINQSE